MTEVLPQAFGPQHLEQEWDGRESGSQSTGIEP
jgi:hypothetical protein